MDRKRCVCAAYDAPCAITPLGASTPTSFSATTFYADIVGAPGDPAVDRAIEELAFHCKHMAILGSYPQARPRG